MKPQTDAPTLQLYLFLFFLASILGFFWEEIILFLQSGDFAKRGFFYGPWLPIYGTGTVLILFLFAPYRQNLLLCFLSSSLLGSSVELSLGFFLHQVFGLRYWDYTGWFLNYHGYISLFSFLGFGICGSIFLHFLYSHLYRFWYHIPHIIRQFLLIILSLLLFVDIFLAFSSPNHGKGVTY